jgi:UDP-N-acetylmuramate dehydrogenase
MNMIKDINEIKNKISGQLLFDENLSKYSWFNLGGPATILFKPKDLNELSFFLKNIKQFNNLYVLGAGSNTLIRDGGYDGIVIKLGINFSRISLLNDNTIVAGSSALDKRVSQFALESSLSGFEFLSCIPGTIGGGIRMNSGCYGEDISNNLVSVQAMDLDGRIRIIHKSDIKFSYRKCDLDKNLIFISATFKGVKKKKSEIEIITNKLVEKKKADQPSKIKTCGSTFMNPPKKKAWKLIKDSGCSEIENGDACISKKHSNFFVNRGKAKSKDLEGLINTVKKKVYSKTGISLELEIKIIGKEK